VTTTKEVLAALREQVNQHKLEGASSLKVELKNQITKILAKAAPAGCQRQGGCSAARAVCGGRERNREDDHHRQAREPA
jgi:hypothetical protein